LAAADSPVEEDRDRNMVVTTTIRAAATAMVMTLPIFGRDCAWCVKTSFELIGWSPVADLRHPN
jgi:hypothetical protein